MSEQCWTGRLSSRPGGVAKKKKEKENKLAMFGY
jgi:hypothetical protein